jgi:RNA polymerase sigma-70 factor (ECF subfamily)
MAETNEAGKHASTRRDELLVDKFSRGDESAFDRIVERYSTDVGALANRLLGWPGEVEDVSQEVFLAAYLGLKKFRCDCSLKSWLFTITVNKCRSHRRRRLLRLGTSSRAADKAPSLSTQTAGTNPMDTETFNHVRSAVAALPAKYREPVVLKYLEEIDTDEIARILGISQNTLHVRLSRARERLRQELNELSE